MKSTKKKRNQDVYLRFGRLAAGLLHVFYALHGEKMVFGTIQLPVVLGD